MPIIQTFEQEFAWAVWEIQEEENELFQLFETYIDFLNPEIQKIKVLLKRKQWLAARICIKNLVQNRGEIFYGIKKDEFNKPFLQNSAVHISISHSEQYAVGILNPQNPVGIDLEEIDSKIHKVVQRFLHQTETEQFPNENTAECCTYWAAKECLYKLYGKKELSFQNEIRIEKAFEQNEFVGKIMKNGQILSVNLQAKYWNNFVMVFSTSISHQN